MRLFATAVSRWGAGPPRQPRSLLAAAAGHADADPRNEGTAWHGPQSTSKELGIDTPLPYLNSSWKIAVELLDRGRQVYHEGKSLCAGQPDCPGGFPRRVAAGDLGRNGPLVYPAIRTISAISER